MNIGKKQTVAYPLALAMLTFCLVTIKIVANCVDGPDEVRFGFPLAWIAPGPTSLSYKIDLLALAIDFGVYLGVWVLLSRTVLFERVLSWRSRLPFVCLWVMSIAAVGWYIFVISIDWYIEGVTFNRLYQCSEVFRYSLHLGPPTAA